jgi:hypothetical protein
MGKELAALKAQPAPVQEPVAVTYKEVADTMNALWGGTLKQVQIAMELANKKLYATPPAAQPNRGCGRCEDMSKPCDITSGSCAADHLDALAAPPAQPAVPDAFGTREGEHPQYIEGWNDCRQAMMEMMK